MLSNAIANCEHFHGMVANLDSSEQMLSNNELVYMVTTGHNGSCRVSIPIRWFGLSRANDLWRRAGSCRVIVMGNAARPGFAGSGVWPGRAGFPSMASPIGRVKPGQIWTSNMLGRLISANTCPFSFSSQDLLHDSRQIVCLDLYRFQIALTGASPGFP